MGTKVGVVYDVVSFQVKRTIVPDNDAELTNAWHVGRDERMITVDNANMVNKGSLLRALGIQDT